MSMITYNLKQLATLKASLVEYRKGDRTEDQIDVAGDLLTEVCDAIDDLQYQVNAD